MADAERPASRSSACWPTSPPRCAPPGCRSVPGTCSPTPTAMSTLDPTDLIDLYWAGRTTLVTRRDSIAPYDRVFRQFFLNASDPVRDLLTLRAQLATETQAVLEVPATDPPGGGRRRTRGSHARPDGLGRGGAAAQVVRRLHPGRTGHAAPDHGPDPAGPAAAAHPADPVGARRADPRPAPDGARVAAAARRPGRAELAAAEGPAAPADPDPRRVRVDGRLLAQPAPVRLLGPARGQPAGPGAASRPGSRCSASAPG